MYTHTEVRPLYGTPSSQDNPRKKSTKARSSLKERNDKDPQSFALRVFMYIDKYRNAGMIALPFTTDRRNEWVKTIRRSYGAVPAPAGLSGSSWLWHLSPSPTWSFRPMPAHPDVRGYTVEYKQGPCDPDFLYTPFPVLICTHPIMRK